MPPVHRCEPCEAADFTINLNCPGVGGDFARLPVVTSWLIPRAASGMSGSRLLLAATESSPLDSLPAMQSTCSHRHSATGMDGARSTSTAVDLQPLAWSKPARSAASLSEAGDLKMLAWIEVIIEPAPSVHRSTSGCSHRHGSGLLDSDPLPAKRSIYLQPP